MVVIEGPLAGTSLGVVSMVVPDSVSCDVHKGKMTAATTFSPVECHSLMVPPDGSQVRGWCVPLDAHDKVKCLVATVCA